MPPTVLICDDELPLRALVRASLVTGGYTLLEAADGHEALAVAREALPDAIVLDMMMPGCSGLDVLRQLRTDPLMKHIRVILLTARAQAEDRARAEAAGADRFMSKPFSPAELSAVVAELVA